MGELEWPWDVGVHLTFADALETTRDNVSLFSGGWSRLLDKSFPESEIIGVQTQPAPYSIHPVMELIVYLFSQPDDRPTPVRDMLLFVELRDIRDLDRPSARADADAQVRARYNDHLHESRIPVLYAISAFGNKVRFYKANKDTGIISPAYVPPSSKEALPPADYLRDGWNVDILSHGGRLKMRRIVKEVLAMSRANIENGLNVAATAGSDEQVVMEDGLKENDSEDLEVQSESGLGH